MTPSQTVFTHEFDAPSYKGTTHVNTGLFINNEWVQPLKGETIDLVNPTTGKFITKASIGTSEDVDIAVKAAHTAFKTTWGLNCPGAVRSRLLYKLADLMEQNIDELIALECLTVALVKGALVDFTLGMVRYYAGLADKVEGRTIETNAAKFAYTLRQPVGVVGQIIPWNAPLLFVAAKLAPALACGCTVVLKPSELTPLSALRVCDLIKEAGFPPGAFNVVVGYGNTVGSALTHHPDVRKVSFVGSLAVGREVTKAAADSNLKKVTLELGGKSPNIIFDDANLDQALKWTESGIFSNAGQMCTAGSRVFVQEGIYDKFIEAFTAAAKTRKLGDPLYPDTVQGPQVSQTQFDRVMRYIDIGKQEGATIVTGGQRHGTEGFFVQPTIFTNTSSSMRIVREEIFGPVAVVIKFKTVEDAIELANDTSYGLASAIFTQNLGTAIKVSNALEAGTVFVNCYNWIEWALPSAGFKESGWGSTSGKEAFDAYMETKAVHMNIGLQI
ncbi:uncharacterized protein FIBRA_08229 [Fibroporia radiculosa]|uniref:Aldehyde dehydrogenase domain-containing protein n=1 Tax=Fibroporia radiculosa TaxID=599839 RepID=J4GGV6_9APHY|nr:uncharacterized protein FIBRA_08229 [Fibroporia radiculosa]CCM05988.1 predicted protein [Fibroporia radiculosa]